MGFELKNVLDQLKEIAKNNDSEDVARAIKTANKYSFKDRLAEMEAGGRVTEDPFDDWHEKHDAGFEDDETVDDEIVDEAPGHDDQYCALCGNTGYRLDRAGEACPNCPEGEGDDKENRDSNKDGLGADPWGIGEGVFDVDNEAGEGEGEGGALDRVVDRSQERGGAVDQVCDRVEERGGSDLGDDPWGIGEDAFDDWHEKHDAGFEDAEDDDSDEDSDLEEEPKTKRLSRPKKQDGIKYTRADAFPGEDGHEGSAVERVVGRSHRSGTGGPVNRVQDRHAKRFAAIDEEIGKVFQTSMERHSWIMNQLNDMTGDMTPDDAAMVKNLLKTAGNADVKGGNC